MKEKKKGKTVFGKDNDLFVWTKSSLLGVLFANTTLTQIRVLSEQKSLPPKKKHFFFCEWCSHFSGTTTFVLS